MTSPFSIYIPIGITYKDYKAEYFAAYIDSGAGACICKSDCFPQEYHEDLDTHTGIDLSNNIIKMNKGVKNPIILLGSYMIKCPPFYFYEITSDVLLGNDFLQRFNKVMFDIVAYQLSFKTPCHEWITVKRIRKAYSKPRPITFTQRTAKRGDIGYKEKPVITRGKPLLGYQPKSLIEYQVNLRKLDSDIEDIKRRLNQCYTDNPLQFWEKKSNNG